MRLTRGCSSAMATSTQASFSSSSGRGWNQKAGRICRNQSPGATAKGALRSYPLRSQLRAPRRGPKARAGQKPWRSTTSASNRCRGRRAAYRAGAEITNERTGQTHDYTRKGGVESDDIVLPHGVSRKPNRAALWNAAELAPEDGGGWGWTSPRRW